MKTEDGYGATFQRTGSADASVFFCYFTAAEISVERVTASDYSPSSGAYERLYRC